MDRRADRTSAGERLLGWILPLAHLIVVTLALVVVAVGTGSLEPALDAIGTIAGIAAYSALWAATWWTTWRALRSVPAPSGEVTVGEATSAGVRWGGIDGLLFYLCLVAYGVLKLVIGVFASVRPGAGVAEPVSASVASVVAVLPFAVAGAIVAYAVGAAIGYVLALFVWCALRLARRSADWCVADGGETGLLAETP